MDEGVGGQALRIARAAGWVVLLQCILLAGVLLFQPERTTPSMVVIAPQSSWAGYVANRVNTVPAHPVRAFVGVDEQGAMADLAADRTQAVLVVDPNQPTDRLLVSSAQGSDAATTIQAVTASVQQASNRRVDVIDATAPVVGDPAGRHGYHLAITWLVCGLTFAVAAGRFGARGPGAGLRALPLVVVAGAAVAAVSVGVVCFAVPSWSGRAGALFLLGTAGVTLSALLARAAVAAAGPAGLAVGAVAAALIAANPSASGADGFGRADVLWQPIGPWTPPGLVVGGVRRLLYLDETVTTAQWGGLLWWAVAAIAVGVIASGRRPGGVGSSVR